MTNRNTGEPLHLTREETAEALRVSLSTVDRYLRDGTLPKSKLGKRLVRIDRSAIDAFLSTPSSVTPAGDDEGVSSLSAGAA